ncbi:MAG: NAD(P)H-hydrate dehydratase [Acidimicrobiia bacterium]
MIPVVTPTEMTAADARTIAAGTPEPVLMQRAGRAVAWRVRAVLGGTYGRRIVVVCGSGNNGGDGRITAATLREWGARVDVLGATRDGIAGDGPGDVAVERLLASADAVVDGIVGTGFRGGLDGALGRLVEQLNAAPCVRVAIDSPSGVDGATGAVRGAAVHADHTVTFAAPKPGLWFHPGRACAGVVTVADIGIDLGPGADRVGVLADADVAALVPPRDPTTHKWRSGVLVVGGSRGMTGAPMLAAHAATHLGAGIVIAALPGAAAPHASGSEVITRELPATAAGDIDAAAIDAVLADVTRFGAVVLGPGLGRAEGTAAVVRTLAAAVPVPLVLDADGLVAIGETVETIAGRPAPTVLTPHDGEFARLTGAPPGEDRIEATRRLAAAADAVVLLKGPTSVIADSGGTVRLNPTGTADLATAGSGDVLSGMIAAFCAMGSNPLDAAAIAAFVHGRAAERARHTGFVATDLPALAGVVSRELAHR